MPDSGKKVIRLISAVSLPFTVRPNASASPQYEVLEKELAASDAPWQTAYEEYLRRGTKQYIEAEIPLNMPFRRSPARHAETQELDNPNCVEMRQSSAAPGGQKGSWHLFDIYSQLDSARDFARRNKTLARRVRIAHIDTGYDRKHTALPPAGQILRELSRDFSSTPPGKFADDPAGARSPKLDDRGHGTATLCILAGGPIPLVNATKPFLKSNELGGAPEAEILPLRVSETVARTRTEALAGALHYAIDQSCDVIVVSMGGTASKFWVDACNRAYENGVVCVAAAGNHLNIGGLPPAPHNTVYPARLNRVIAASGVMADGLPYDLPDAMSGNWGPLEKMRTSLAAYSPNIPWAEAGCLKTVSQNGAGTAAAAQQIAAAAALWLQMHGLQYEKNKSWPRAEAVRQDLLRSAKSPGSHYEELGRGILQAKTALEWGPQDFPIEPADTIWFPWLKPMRGSGLQPATASGDALEQMLHVEYAQMELSDLLLIPMLKSGYNSVSGSERQHVREYLIEQSHLASPQLKHYLKTGEVTAKPPAASISSGSKAEAPGLTDMRLPWTPPVPKTRRLRVYTLDLSYAVQQSTVALSQIALEIPWETDLKPGPVDEYLEVIDYDPASGCFYEPVNLNDTMLVVQDGLSPSPNNPLFHQQMVYAVARKTIDIFESALGRRIFWTGPPLALWNKGLIEKEKVQLYRNAADDSIFVQRLRIYPHAMRQPNAFYSQRKGALLFGYFPSQDEGRLGNEIVHTCLSYDIVAHETTHAILDGMNRTLVYATNPDVLAFHEAFADIVALLSRFQMKEIVASQIASTRGVLSSANILGQLGREFGIATGRFQSLRAYLGRYMEEFERVTRRDPISRYATDEEIEKAVQEAQESRTYHRKTVWEKTVPDPRKLGEAEDAHARGAILVAAIYGALVSIYETRAVRLLRLAGATDGSGRASDLSPELIDLLAEQLTRSAMQVLHMCIRAIDYLPPTDITFGEYLRAILTADFDLVPEDRLHYRVAFIESFRNWGIKLEDVRSSSEDSLLWQKLNPLSFVAETNELARLLAKFVQQDFQYASSRQDSFRVTYKWRWTIHRWLTRTFKKSPGFDRLFGLDLSLKDAKFYVRALRRVERIGPGGRPMPQALLQITQTKSLPEKGEHTFIMGGATLIANTSTPGIDYVVLKNISSKGRKDKAEKTALEREENSLRATYFGPDGSKAEPFAIIHEQEEDQPWQLKKRPLAKK
jgi:hypothetical protein